MNLIRKKNGRVKKALTEMSACVHSHWYNSPVSYYVQILCSLQLPE